MKYTVISRVKNLVVLVILSLIILIFTLGINHIFSNEEITTNSIKELRSLPSNYPEELAFKNKDFIIGPWGDPINVSRFYALLDNIELNRKDKIRFSYYSFEGNPPQPTIGILEFDGNQIKLYIDNSRLSSDNEIYLYTGERIELKEVDHISGRKILSYYLIDANTSEENIIFSYFPFYPYVEYLDGISIPNQ